MKNSIIGVFIAIFILPLVSGPMIASATTPTFQTQEEIDAYYDAQKIQNKENYEQKVQGIKDQLEIDLDNLRKETEAKKLEGQRKIFGENFEIIKPFLPESNPDPEAIYLDLLKNPTQNGVSRIKILMLYNPELAEKVRLISQRESAIAKSKLIEINKEICISNYGPNSEWNGVNNENGEVYCRCLNGYVMGENKKCILTSINNKKEETKKIIEPTKSIPVVSSSNTENKETIKTEADNKNIINPEPLIKVKWYQKIFNWFKRK